MIHLQGFSSPSLLTSIEITSGVEGNKEYKTQVRAQNIYGYGEWSDIFTIKAAQEPDQVSLASLGSVVDGLSVKLSWA
jgi:hypothetical protein